MKMILVIWASLSIGTVVGFMLCALLSVNKRKEETVEGGEPVKAELSEDHTCVGELPY